MVIFIWSVVAKTARIESKNDGRKTEYKQNHYLIHKHLCLGHVWWIFITNGGCLTARSSPAFLFTHITRWSVFFALNSRITFLCFSCRLGGNVTQRMCDSVWMPYVNHKTQHSPENQVLSSVNNSESEQNPMCVSGCSFLQKSGSALDSLTPPPPQRPRNYILYIKKKKTFLWHFHLIRSAKHLKITGCVYLLPYLLLMSSNQDVTKGGLLDYGQVVYAYAEWGIKEWPIMW